MKTIMKTIALLTMILGITGVANAYYIGQRGNDVADLQITLLEAGYDIPALSSGVAQPGYFGSQTQEALAAYTASKGTGLKFGAVSGPEVYNRQFFRQGSSNGGKIATTSTAATYTTAASDFNGTPSMLLWTPNVNTTVSLSSTSTFAYVPQIGDVARVLVLNASSTAASTITFAAVDANLDLQFSEATGGDLVLNGLDWAELILVRQTANKVSVIFNEFTEAD